MFAFQQAKMLLILGACHVFDALIQCDQNAVALDGQPQIYVSVICLYPKMRSRKGRRTDRTEAEIGQCWYPGYC